MLLFVFVLLIGMVSAQGGWDDVVGDDDTAADDTSAADDAGSGADDTAADDSADSELDLDSGSSGGDTTSNSGKSTFYTENFWIALGLASLAILIFLLLFYFLLKRPRNKWEKQAPSSTVPREKKAINLGFIKIKI